MEIDPKLEPRLSLIENLADERSVNDVKHTCSRKKLAIRREGYRQDTVGNTGQSEEGEVVGRFRHDRGGKIEAMSRVICDVSLCCKRVPLPQL